MANILKFFYVNNRNILRIVRYSLISLLLLILTWFLDYRDYDLKGYLPDILLLSPEVTSSFLSILSGTFLTVTTFTFTTILTVLNKYSSSFTPRIVQDFIDKPNVLSLFGVFIGGFFYTVLSLFLVQNIDSDLPLISGTIAIFYAVAAMVTFMLFVKRVLSDIKVSSVIENIYQATNRLIEDEAQKRKDSEKFDMESYDEEIKIYANKTGFLYEIDTKNLIKKLDIGKCQLIIDKKIGEYVSKGMYIANLYSFDKFPLKGEEKNKYLSELSDFLLINVNKNEYRDYHFELTKLVEIAMMALSPGVNDPNTAIEAIDKISYLLGQLFSTDNFYLVLDENEDTKIIYNGYTVKEELFKAYAQIIHYGKEDPLVSQAILKGLYMVYIISGQSAKDDVEEYFEYVYKLCSKAQNTPLDQEALDIIYDDFATNRDDKSDKDAVREKE
ncbi:MAG: DUF2254 family protein [Anaerococcus sp.]|nr:DUF2254 domain-containing protein [Peptoniphilaceae bacterium]MDY3055952.1 DUF2254 family protein [Anaerococcus sp.]